MTDTAPEAPPAWDKTWVSPPTMDGDGCWWWLAQCSHLHPLGRHIYSSCSYSPEQLGRMVETAGTDRIQAVIKGELEVSLRDYGCNHPIEGLPEIPGHHE